MKREREEQKLIRNRFEELKQEDAERKHHDRDREHERPHEGRREGSGDDPKRHAAILAERWKGSPPPTAERYARALSQWRALPGAVVRVTPKLSKDDETAAKHEKRHHGFDRKETRP